MKCLYCLHYKRECVWPTVFADGRHGKRRASSASSANAPPSPASCSHPSDVLTLATSPLVGHAEESQTSEAIERHNPQSQITWYPVDLGEGQEKLLFHHFSTCTLPTAIRRHAHPSYSTYQDVFQFGFERPDIMNVFLGIAVLRIGQNNENFTIEATKFYNPSVNAVSRSIREGKINGTEEWLLVLIAFMVIFEVSLKANLEVRADSSIDISIRTVQQCYATSRRLSAAFSYQETQARTSGSAKTLSQNCS